MVSAKEAFFAALDELAVSNPWILDVDPEHDIAKIRRLVVDKLRQEGKLEAAIQIHKATRHKLTSWFKEWLARKRKGEVKTRQVQEDQTTGEANHGDSKRPRRVKMTIGIDEDLILLYYALQKSEKYSLMLSAYNIKTLEDFINVSAKAYWKLEEIWENALFEIHGPKE